MTELIVFERKTGKFQPLDFDTLASLSAEQSDAYHALEAAAAEVTAAEAAAKAANDQIRADVATLAEAQRNAPRFGPNERENARVATVKAMIAENRRTTFGME